MGHVMKNLNYAAAIAVCSCLYMLFLVPLVSLAFGSVTVGIAYCKLKAMLVYLIQAVLDDVKRPNQGCCSTRPIQSCCHIGFRYAWQRWRNVINC